MILQKLATGRDAFYYLVEDLATMCENDNPSFDRHRFWSAIQDKSFIGCNCPSGWDTTNGHHNADVCSK
jgi:hypothetical protein